ERRLERAELLDGRVGANALVPGERRRALFTRDLDRDDLSLEAALIRRSCGAQVRFDREAVVVLARDVPLLGDELGGDPLRDETATLLVPGEDLGTERLAPGCER